MSKIEPTKTRPWLATMALVLFCLNGCQRPKGELETPELEAVDVSPSLAIDAESDQREVVRPPELVGVLPGGCPDDLPLYLPASLVNFGPAGDQRHYVSLLSPHSRPQVERELGALAQRKGWTATPISGGESVLRKDGRQVWLRIEDARPGTRYRFEYTR